MALVCGLEMYHSSLDSEAHLRLNPVKQRVDILRRGQPHRLLHLKAVRPQVLILRPPQMLG